jgi:hypothetical protein
MGDVDTDTTLRVEKRKCETHAAARAHTRGKIASSTSLSRLTKRRRRRFAKLFRSKKTSTAGKITQPVVTRIDIGRPKSTVRAHGHDRAQPIISLGWRPRAHAQHTHTGAHACAQPPSPTRTHPQKQTLKYSNTQTHSCERTHTRRHPTSTRACTHGACTHTHTCERTPRKPLHQRACQ